MAMELLPESVSAVAPSEVKPEQSADFTKSVAGVEFSGSKDESQTKYPLHSKGYWQRIPGKIDPLFYFTCCLSIAALVGVILILQQRSEQQMGFYLEELKASNAEIARRLTDSDIDRAAPISQKDTYAVTTESADDVVLQPQTIPESDSSDSTAAEVTNATDGTNEPEAVDPIQLVELNNPVEEIADLKLKLSEQTQQIELLSLENHELRLQVKFGHQDRFDGSIQPAVDTDSKSQPTELVKSKGTIARESIGRDVNAFSAEMKRLVIDGYNAYVSGNHLLAHDMYSRAVQLDPLDRDANLGIAAAAMALGQYKLAADRYRHLLSLNADDQEAFSAMLGLSATSSMIETELLTHIENNAVQPAILYSIVGHHYGQANKWLQASEMFVRSIASVKNTAPPADYYFNLAVSLEHAAQPDRAMEYYLLALSTPNGATFDRELARRQARELTR